MIILALAQITYAGNISFEFAGGAGANVTPLSSKWTGSVGSEGLYFKEYAVRISYPVNNMFSARCAFGWMKYYHRDNVWYSMPPTPDPHFWGPRERNIKSVYFIPSLRAELPMMNIDAGLLLYDDHNDNIWFYEAAGPLKEKFYIGHSLGVELGEGDNFLFGRNYDSFPMISGGGIWEFGIGYRYRSQYEHKLYLATFGGTMAGVGYRGEFKISGNSALSAGWMIGSTDHDTVHIFNLGYIYGGD